MCLNLSRFQGMTPIAKIEIAIAIPISISKTFQDPIAIVALRSRDLLGDHYFFNTRMQSENLTAKLDFIYIFFLRKVNFASNK